MSVQQIEEEISRLAPAEAQKLASWLNGYLASARRNGRPRVGEITSERVVCSEDCFAPLTDEEMQEWGFA
jgi:hypothetical protein